LAPLAFFAVLLRHVLPASQMLTRRDAFILYLPVKQFLVDALRAHRVPVWYPFDGLGVSYVGASIGGLFHPLNALYLFLSAEQGLKWQSLLAYPFAAWGAHKLARRMGAPPAGRLLAALGFAASGYLLSVSDNLPYLLSAAVLPWSWLAADRLARRADLRSAAWLTGALTLAIVGGDVQGALLQSLTAAVIVLFARAGGRRKRLVGLAASFALTGLLCLPQLLPTWFTFRGSGRSAGIPLADTLTWSLHPLRLVEFALGPLLPTWLITGADTFNDALGGKAGATWAHSELLGLPLCLLALGALLRPLPRRLRVVAGIGVVALALSLGRYGGIYAQFVKVVPLWSAFRYPEKLVPFALLPLCLLAGWGVRALMRADPRLTRGLLAVFGLLVVWLSVTSPARVDAFARLHLAAAAVPSTDIVQQISDLLRGRTLLGLGLLSVLLLVSVRGGRAAGWSAAGLNALHVLLLSGWVVGVGPSAFWLTQDSPFRAAALVEQARGTARMCWHLPNYVYTGPAPDDGEVEVLQSDVRTLAPVANGRFKIANLRAYFPGGDAFFQAACGIEPPCGSACARVGGAGFGVADPAERARLEANGLRVLAEQADPKSLLVEDPLARPFASLPAVRHVPAERLRKAIFDPARRPAVEAILAGPGPDLPAPGGTISADRSTPGRIAARMRLDAPGFAVFALSCAAGWSAQLDGAPAELTKADGSLCALPVPAGAHTVRLSYRPWGWPWAFAGPLLALAIALLLLRREKAGPGAVAIAGGVPVPEEAQANGAAASGGGG